MKVSTPPTYRSVFKLVWPLAIGMANNAIMQFVDRVFLSRESETAIAAVLPASMLSWVFVGFFQAVVAYSGAFVAQYHGAGDREGCVRSYFTALVMALISGAFCLLLIYPGNMVFALVGHTGDLLRYERTYYSIVMLGAAALCMTTASQCYFTGLGFTRSVFWVNVIGNIVNIVLDPILIFGLGPIPAYGIAGAAVATAIAQTTQFLILWNMALRREEIKGFSKFVSTGIKGFSELFRRMLRFGVPSGLYTVLNLLSFTIFVFLTSKLGVTELAVSNAVFSVAYLLMAPIEGFSIGAETLVGQYQGAGNSKYALKAGNKTIVTAVVYSVVTSLLVLVFHKPILSLFAGTDSSMNLPEMVSLSFTLFIMMTTWQCFDAVDITSGGALKGAGDTRFIMIWMLVCAFLIWMPLVFFVFFNYRTMPLMWATQIVYIAVICIGTLWRWLKGPWKKISLRGTPAPSV